MAKILILGAGAMGSAFSVPSLERQHEVIIAGTHLEDAFIDEIKNNISFSSSSLKSLERKKIIEIKKFKEDRNIENEFETKKKIVLSKLQSKVLKQINLEFENKDVVLLEGVTSSGKTEIYLKIIEKFL